MPKFDLLRSFALSCFISIFGLVSNAPAAETGPIRVRLHINADRHLESDVTHLVKRELHAFPDVEVVDTKPHFELHIVGVDDGHKTEDGTPDYSLAYLAGASAIRRASEVVTDELARQSVAKALSGALDVDHSWMQSGSDLPLLCNELVAAFNSGVLQKTRIRLEETRAERVQARRIRYLQYELSRLGYAPGPSDGVLREDTRAAVRAYQTKHGLPVDGRYSTDLLEHIWAVRIEWLKRFIE